MTPDQLPKFHTLDVTINGEGPFTAVSQLRGGLSLSLFAGMDGFFQLAVRFELDTHTTKTYRLKTLKPGDRLKFTYDGPSDDAGSTIDEIEKLERNEPPPQLIEGHRLGLDVVRKNGETNRLAHPPNGTLSVSLANVPQDHARIWVYAGNEETDWSGNLDDLYAGDSLEFEIVTTDRFDEFPDVINQTNMICFDVYVNGEKRCRAGRDDLAVMTCNLDWVKAGTGPEELALSVGGLYEHESGGNGHLRWLERLELNVGDEITIKIAEADTADEPVSETVSTPEWIQEQKRKYFEAVKAEFEEDDSRP